VAEKRLYTLTGELFAKEANTLTINQPNRWICPEISKTIKEKLFNSMPFINTLRKVAEPKIINLKKLENVLR
jgi:hypothetical protein